MTSIRKRSLACAIPLLAMSALAWSGAVDVASQAAEPSAPYQTKYRVVNVHRHGALATEAALLAELEVMDRVGVDKVVMLDGDSPPGTLPAWLELQKKYPERLAVFLKADFRDSAKPDFFEALVRK